MRTSFFQFKQSRAPNSIGLCQADGPGLSSIVNEAQQRLIEAGGETGWWGSYAKYVFNVSKDDPYITCPREVARLINIDICRFPIRTNNEFQEFLEFGAGLQRPTPSCATNSCSCSDGMQAYDRNNFPTMRDLTPGNKLRVFMGSAGDNGKRIFFDAIDANGKQIYTLDNGVRVKGFFLTLDAMFPFVESPPLNAINGVQKDVTIAPVQVYGVNTATDESVLLPTYEPSEQTASYRRYYLNNLPTHCCECDAPNNTVQVTAMAKLAFIPVQADTDYLIIGNIPALKEMCQSIRYSEMDTPAAQQMAIVKKREAIKLLNQELIHFLGKERPAFNYAPFGYATLERAGIGMI
jgi:hypothetical protein